MGIEIERKFLLASDGWRALVKRSEMLRQGYLARGDGLTVRVRSIDDARGYITIKAGGVGISRSEFEYEVPIADALELLDLCRDAQVEKVRHTLDLAGGDWVVDEFAGRHDGLILAEVELESPTAHVERRDWLGVEVTDDPRYYNSRLAALPRGEEI